MKTLVKILAAALMTAQTVSCAPQKIAIAAHRGFWNCEEAGYAENSISLLRWHSGTSCGEASSMCR